MPKFRDITGQRFGKLVAQRYVEVPGKNKKLWEMLCDCGTTSYAASTDLLKGKVKSCGCKRGMEGNSYIDITGKRFGRLVALEPIRVNGALKWKLQCDCGNITTNTYNRLNSGVVRSCGCLQRDYMRSTYIDITGQKFGRLTAEYMFRENGRVKWHCSCECGGQIDALGAELRLGKPKSCGCLKIERTKECTTTHGMSNSRIYRTWFGMKKRCLSPNDKAYKHYGGRGISICDEWMDFQKFYDWSMENGYTDELTIERIDVNGNYCPENCKWIPFKEQAYNKRTNRLITYKGETKTMKEWSEEYGIRMSVIHERLKKGMSVEETFTTPVEVKRNLVTYNGETKNLSEWARETGINRATIQGRLQCGWPVSDALTLKPSKIKRERRLPE